MAGEKDDKKIDSESKLLSHFITNSIDIYKNSMYKATDEAFENKEK